MISRAFILTFFHEKYRNVSTFALLISVLLVSIFSDGIAAPFPDGNMQHLVPSDTLLSFGHFLAPNIGLKNSTLCSMGRNQEGQLSDFDSTGGSVQELKCDILQMIGRKVAVSQQNSFVLDVYGKLYVAGATRYGQTGLGLDVIGEERVNFTRVPQVAVKDVCAMEETTMIWTLDGEIRTAGRNQYGQTGLGLGVRADGTEKQHVTFEKVYMDRYLHNVQIDGIHCAVHSAYVLANHSIFSWGRNDMYQLGDGSQWNQYVPQPMHFFMDSQVDIELMSVGSHEAYALDASNNLWAWGRGYSGQMGYLSEMGWIDYNQVLPGRITFFHSDNNILSLAAGDGYVSILLDNGQVTSVGSNQFGQLSIGLYGGNIFSARSPNLTNIDEPVFKLSAGSSTSFAFGDAGSLYGVGRGDTGILGTLQNASIFKPIDISVPIRQVASASHLIALSGNLCGDYVEENFRSCGGHGYCGFNDGHSYCACEAGYSNQLVPNQINTTCTACPPGTYASVSDDRNGITECISCPVSTFSPTVAAYSLDFCQPCAAGYITESVGSVSEDDCVACPMGKYGYLNTTSKVGSCIDCPTGTFNYNNATIGPESCTRCTSGTYQPLEGQISSSACLKCPAGTWSDTIGAGTNETCLPCPLGTFSTSTGINSSLLCEKCPPSTYNDAGGGTSCFSCPSNLVSPLGATSESECEYCPPGRYSAVNPDSGLTICVACEPGTYASHVNATSPDVCIPCPAGSYMNDSGAFNESSCSLCAASTYSEGGASLCTACPEGTYSPVGAPACTSCPPGKVLIVPIDEVSDNNEENCDLCPAGYWTQIEDNGFTRCIACSRGTYSEVKGAEDRSFCIACPAGTFSNGLALNSSQGCIPCPKGYWSDTTPALDISTCIQCEKGTYLPEMGSAQPDDCIPCPEGTYGPDTAAGDLGDCIPCPAGTASDGIAQANVSVCEICPAQTFSPSGASECTPCPVGHYTNRSVNNGEGMTSISDCIPCPAGSYFEIVNGTAQCTLCPLGTASNGTAENSPSACKDCPKGTYSEEEGSSECEICPQGTWSSTIAATSHEDCIPCQRGFFSEVIGATVSSVCQQCPKGTYQPYEASSFCNLCPNGTFVDVQGSLNVTDCVKCPAGTYSGVEGATSIESCIPCSAGSYNEFEAQSTEDACIKCSKGRFSPIVGSSTQSSCKLCPSDTYSPEIGRTSCIDCPDGYTTGCTNVVGESDCDAEDMIFTSESECRPCAPGSYMVTDENGLRSCVLCPPGYYSEMIGANSSDTCTPCPVGTYTSPLQYPNGGVPSFSNCLLCPEGTFNPNNASVGEDICEECPPATWSTAGSEQCSDCNPGTAASGTGGSESICQTCPPGTWSGSAFSECVPCNPGYFNPTSGAKNISFCIPCPVGTANPSFGSTQQSACEPCKAGFFADSLASPSCNPCAPGTYVAEEGSDECLDCPPGSFSLNSSAACTLCNVGSYSPNPRSTSRAACKICSANTYNPEEGASECKACGEGGLCPAGSSSVMPNLIALKQEDQSVVNPAPTVDQTTAYWLKWGTVILISVLAVLLVLVLSICSFCSDRKEIFSLFRTADVLYSTAHDNEYGTTNKKTKTRLGGVCAMLALPGALIVFVIIIADAFAFNTQIVPNFRLTDSSDELGEKGVSLSDDPTFGSYRASVAVMGNFPECRIIDQSEIASKDGFWIEIENFEAVEEVDGARISRMCEPRSFWQGARLDHCYCEITCEQCRLQGISQSVRFGSPRQFTTSFAYELVVPHYTRITGTDERAPFLLNGTAVASDDQILYGEEPVELFLSIFETRYVTTPNFIFSALGFSGKSFSGVTAQLLTTSYGDSPTLDERQEALEDDDDAGIHIAFSMSRSNLAFVQQEELIQDIVAILANLAALIGAAYEIGRILMNQYERWERRLKWLRKRYLEWKEQFMEARKKRNEPKIEKIPRNVFKEDQNPWEFSKIERPIEPKESDGDSDEESAKGREDLYMVKNPWSMVKEVETPEGSKSVALIEEEEAYGNRIDALTKNYTPTRDGIPQGDLIDTDDSASDHDVDGADIPESSLQYAPNSPQTPRIVESRTHAFPYRIEHSSVSSNQVPTSSQFAGSIFSDAAHRLPTSIQIPSSLTQAHHMGGDDDSSETVSDTDDMTDGDEPTNRI